MRALLDTFGVHRARAGRPLSEPPDEVAVSVVTISELEMPELAAFAAELAARYGLTLYDAAYAAVAESRAATLATLDRALVGEPIYRP